MGRQFVGHALASHAASKRFCGFVFVNLCLRGAGLGLPGSIVHNSHVEAAHLLQTTDIAYRNALPGLEFRSLELTGVNARHIVGHGFAHGFFHRHNTHTSGGLVMLGGKSLTVFLELSPRQNIGGLALTTPAYGAVFHRVGLAAHGAAEYARHGLVPNKTALHRDGFHLANGIACGFNL